MMEIKSLIEALETDGFVIRSSYLREDGQVIVEINGVPMTLLDQALRLAHGQNSLEDILTEIIAGPDDLQDLRGVSESEESGGNQG